MKNMIYKPVTELIPNPNNPRTIDKAKFKQLVQSIKQFPEMLNLRPIVVDSDMVVLGGNMRLKACIEAKLSHVPVIIADNLTEEQQKEFIIKDNVGFGEWDWEVLANEWDIEMLSDWALNIPIEVTEDIDDEISEDSEDSITKTLSFKYTIDEAARIENELYLIDSSLEGALQRLIELNKKQI